MKTALVVVAVLISWITNAAPVPLAREQAWNADWRFCRSDWPGAEAAGFDDLKSRSGIRISIGLYNTEEEMLLAAEVLKTAYQNVVLARKDGEV